MFFCGRIYPLKNGILADFEAWSLHGKLQQGLGGIHAAIWTNLSPEKV